MKLKNIMLFFILSLCAFFLITGCGSNKKKVARDRDILLVATNQSYVPFEFKDGASIGYQGFEIDLVKAVAKHLDKQIDFIGVPFKDIISCMENKDADVAVTGMTITAERSAKVRFTAPIYRSKTSILVSKESSVNNLADLQDKKVACVGGSTEAQYARSSGIYIEEYSSSIKAMKQVVLGRTDAALIALPVAEYFSAKYGQGRTRVIVVDDSQEEYFGFVLSNDSERLQRKINQIIIEMKKNGEYTQIYRKWFHAGPPVKLPDSAAEVIHMQNIE